MAIKGSFSIKEDVEKIPPSPIKPLYPCHVKDQPSGGLSVTFQLSPMDVQRLKNKAYTKPLAEWLYENVLKQAISSALY